MLKKFILKNYKNFKDEIILDFGKIAGYQFSPDCISDGLISKMLIYGRNATGKTNLGNALMDIWNNVWGSMARPDDGILLNADSLENAASFSYEFEFENVDLLYKYSRFSNRELKMEELFINGKNIFKCDFENDIFSFDNLKEINAETANIERYRKSIKTGNKEMQENRLPFLRWLISNMAFGLDSVLLKLTDYVGRMNILTVRNDRIGFARNAPFYEFLEESNRLNDLEEFLNEMGVACNLVIKKLPDGERKLYFSHKKLIPFYETASSGTLALINLYRRLIPGTGEPSFIYLDEFDAFYHYEMAEKVITFFKNKYPKCQVIMTTHNTNLMTNRLMRPDCLFILSGSGTLTALCDATARELREGHNLEKMYISGEFEKYE